MSVFASRTRWLRSDPRATDVCFTLHPGTPPAARTSDTLFFLFPHGLQPNLCWYFFRAAHRIRSVVRHMVSACFCGRAGGRLCAFLRAMYTVWLLRFLCVSLHTLMKMRVCARSLLYFHFCFSIAFPHADVLSFGGYFPCFLPYSLRQHRPQR